MTGFEQLKQKLMTARKERDAATLAILKVIVGEVEAIAYKTGKPPTDEQVIKVIRKMVASNEETMSHMEGGRAPLLLETEYLKGLLPQTASREVISFYLKENCLEEIKSAKSDGQAVGIAIKKLKEAIANGNSGAVADNADVAAVVAELRK